MNASTPAAPRRTTAGIDWASEDHAVAVVDPDGAVVTRCTFEHTGAGLRALIKALQRVDVDAVGSDRPMAPSSTPTSWPTLCAPIATGSPP